ncbi:MAG: D-glycero-beta-D-manno-heptose 1,7-bisphosphate 7-phosphatase [Gammaproteobacteria bacterium]|nr:D-glycero-beta-D-manno-heptose 1,7-bisphosphate 7-phosphatase [Gammaproteobacteria bacterium]NNJ73265.1 D-glycero-beta-D-manno-heptose 1,7-bisphosphate 7-phosphatase [Enterobacterales bacterium]
MSVKLIILDRDGVINHDSDDYIRAPEDWRPIKGSAEAIAKLNQAGYIVTVATNQSGIGRGFFSVEVLTEIHGKMFSHLAKANARVEQLEYCPDHPNSAGPFRKPAPGMALKLLRDFNAEPESTWFVGDSISDMKCALNAGCKPALVLTGKGNKTSVSAEFQDLEIPVFNDLEDFTEQLLA